MMPPAAYQQPASSGDSRHPSPPPIPMLHSGGYHRPIACFLAGFEASSWDMPTPPQDLATPLRLHRVSNFSQWECRHPPCICSRLYYQIMYMHLQRLRSANLLERQVLRGEVMAVLVKVQGLATFVCVPFHLGQKWRGHFSPFRRGLAPW